MAILEYFALGSFFIFVFSCSRISHLVNIWVSIKPSSLLPFELTAHLSLWLPSCTFWQIAVLPLVLSVVAETVRKIHFFRSKSLSVEVKISYSEHYLSLPCSCSLYCEQPARFQLIIENFLEYVLYLYSSFAL